MNDKQSNKTLPHHVPIKSLMRTTTNMAPLKGLLRQKKQRHERHKEVVVNCSMGIIVKHASRFGSEFRSKILQGLYDTIKRLRWLCIVA